MSGSGRKHSSKWDLKEDEFVRESIRDKESRSGWFSPKGGGYNNGHKLSGREVGYMLGSKPELRYSSREPIPGSRGSRNEDNLDDYMGNFKETTSWGGDGSYSMKMSPVFHECGQQSRRRSPKSDWTEPRR